MADPGQGREEQATDKGLRRSFHHRWFSRTRKRENNVIILDLVVTGGGNDDLGFVRNLNRLNVARTRARDGMIFVGNLAVGAT